MLRYEKLWNAFIEGEKNFAAYRRESWDFAGNFISGLISFLGCPEDRVRLLPPDSNADVSMTYPISGALKYQDDGYWSMGVFVAISSTQPDEPGVVTMRPEAGFLLSISFKKEGDKFLIRLRDNKHAIIEKDADLQEHYENIFNLMKRNLATDLGLRTATNTVKRIGFI